MRAILEIRAGEGGDDAKLFIYDMLRMYQRYCQRNNIRIDLLDVTDSAFVTEVVGEVQELISYEAGVHRVQRVPPTESRGRRHSSTITVAVLAVPEKQEDFDVRDVEITTFRGPGPGGQHRNTSDTGVRAKHKPSGIEASCSRGRSLQQNKQSALRVLQARLQDRRDSDLQAERSSERLKQIGTGGRAEKIRTYTFTENRVKDVRCKKTLYCLDRVMDGELEKIYEKIAPIVQ